MYDMMKKGGNVKATKKQAAIAIAMKKAGKAPKKSMQYGGEAASMKPEMKMGGSLKPVAANQKGLAKLPTEVRNKMGYQKNGGASKMKDGGKLGSGERFASLKSKIKSKGGKSDKAAGAIAASIGRKKYGAKKMAAMSAAGRKKS